MAAMIAVLVLAIQAEPAPAAPDPGHRAFEPPPGPVPLPEPSPADPPAANAFELDAGAAYRLAPSDLGPSWGVAVGAAIERRLLRLGTRGEIGLALGVDYRRFSKSVQASTRTESGAEIPFDGVRVISQTGFGIAPVGAVRFGRVRPFVSAGAGFTVGYFSTAERDLRPGSQDAVRGFVGGSAGVGVDVGRGTSLVARAEAMHPLLPPSFHTDTGSDLRLFETVADFGVAVRFVF